MDNRRDDNQFRFPADPSSFLKILQSRWKYVQKLEVNIVCQRCFLSVFIIFIVIFLIFQWFPTKVMIFYWFLLYQNYPGWFSLGTGVKTSKKVIPDGFRCRKNQIFFSPDGFSIRGVVKSRVISTESPLATISSSVPEVGAYLFDVWRIPGAYPHPVLKLSATYFGQQANDLAS